MSNGLFETHTWNQDGPSFTPAGCSLWGRSICGTLTLETFPPGLTRWERGVMIRRERPDRDKLLWGSHEGGKGYAEICYSSFECVSTVFSPFGNNSETEINLLQVGQRSWLNHWSPDLSFAGGGFNIWRWPRVAVWSINPCSLAL